MKTILITIVALFTFCLGVKSNSCLNLCSSVRQDSVNYKVYKIDSINNYYLIYAKKGHTLFKIISKKESSKKCNRIKVNKVYKFQLHSILTVNGRSVIPANQIMELSGWRIDQSTTIDFEGDSIRDLYNADNIKGICFIKTKKK